MVVVCVWFVFVVGLFLIEFVSSDCFVWVLVVLVFVFCLFDGVLLFACLLSLFVYLFLVFLVGGCGHTGCVGGYFP